MRKTPLAWRNLTHDPRRLATSLAGVGFAVVLIFTELGFLKALLDSTVEPLRRVEADRQAYLVMVHRDKESLVDSYRFSRRWLVAAEACPGVAKAEAVFFEAGLAAWHNPITGRSKAIRVISADSEDLLAILSGAPAAVRRLAMPGTGLFDVDSKRAFGYADLPVGGAGLGSEAVLSRAPLRLVGAFELGTDFINDGNLVVALRTFDDLFPTRRVREPDVPTVDLGLIRLAEGVDPEPTRNRLERELGAEAVGVRVLAPGRMIDAERWFWLQHTPVGWIFLLGVALGFVVGVVICFQVLSSDIRDHLAEYATLKAIGYGNSYLVKVVVLQASLLAVLGFLPSLAAADALYRLLRGMVGLPMRLDGLTVLAVFALTLLMCLSSAYLAIRKLFRADPAELFR